MVEDAYGYELPDIFSRRQRKLMGTTSADIFTYDELPTKLRNQVAQIILDAFGPFYDRRGHLAPGHKAYEHIVYTMRREAGVHSLTKSKHISYADELLGYLPACSFSDWLDAIDLSLRLIDHYVRENHEIAGFARIKPDEALGEFNARCLEAGFGYQYVTGGLIRIDSQYMHKETVVPALSILADSRFKAANEEFREAHTAFRHANYKDCLVGCARAFESVLKVIGLERGWGIEANDPAKKLVAAANKSGFIPSHSQNSINHLVGLLESSVPSVRNKLGGHGAGAEPHDIPVELAAFQLHQTAAVILFLASHDDRLGK